MVEIIDLNTPHEYRKEILGRVISNQNGFKYQSSKGLLDTFFPKTTTSEMYKNWVAQIDERTCFRCKSQDGKIFQKDEIPDPKPPLHPKCRCRIIAMQAILAGEETKDGTKGADYWLKHYGVLPSNYISEEDLLKLGWRFGKNPAKYAKGKMLTAGYYDNSNGHLPQITGRTWQEADINYYEGHRNSHRIIWSNDGLIFVTYDHYQTFYEII